MPFNYLRLRISSICGLVQNGLILGNTTYFLRARRSAGKMVRRNESG
jgi:hypothetical protein